MLTQERLKEVLYYNPHVGVFVWRHNSPRRRRGSAAGSPVRGYIRIAIDGKVYGAHQLAWLYVNGRFPEYQIDHVDGDKSNNLISNLRDAPQSKNSLNTRRSVANTSGVKGVSFVTATGKWAGSIKKEGKFVFRGFFETLEAAEIAVRAAREEFHGEYANHGVHKYEAEEMLDAD